MIKTSLIKAARPNKSFLAQLLTLVLCLLVMSPYLLLFVISLGSGWSFPAMMPDRLNFAAWRHFLADRDQILLAVTLSMSASLVVGVLSVTGGLVIGRAIRRSDSTLMRFLVYLPFVVSPIIVSIGLYDLLVRLNVIGNVASVIAMQTLFGLSFSSIFFSEFWSPRAERLEQLVRNLGGGDWAVWRHAIFPHLTGLIIVCFLQTSLYSWLDYGIVSIVGGGHVPSVTTKLFGYIRESNVNHAAQASIVLLTPALLVLFLNAPIYWFVSRTRPISGESI